MCIDGSAEASNVIPKAPKFTVSGTKISDLLKQEVGTLFEL